MAWTRVQGTFEVTGSGTSANVSFSATVTNGGVVCGVVFYTGSEADIISLIADDKSNAYTKVVSQPFTGGNFRMAAFRSSAPITNGALTITVTTSSSTTNLWIIIDEFTPPSAGTITTDGSASAQGTGISTSGNFTTSNNGDLIYSGQVSSANATAGSGFTLATASGSDFSSEFQTQTSAGSIAGTWTGATGQVVICAFAVAAQQSQQVPYQSYFQQLLAS